MPTKREGVQDNVSRIISVGMGKAKLRHTTKMGRKLFNTYKASILKPKNTAKI